MKMKHRLGVSAAAAAMVCGAGLLTAPTADAAMVTIYPNYSDANCLGRGSVSSLQVAASPGNSTNWRPGRWTAVTAPAGRSVQLTANLFCKTWYGAGAYRTAIKRVTVVANKSYYF